MFLLVPFQNLGILMMHIECTEKSMSRFLALYIPISEWKVVIFFYANFTFFENIKRITVPLFFLNSDDASASMQRFVY